MKYTLEERLEIGRRIYDGEISRYEAAEQDRQGIIAVVSFIGRCVDLP